jgi:hypothetical protein
MDRLCTKAEGDQYRQVASGEVAGALAWGVARAAAKTDAELDAELGHHRHSLSAAERSVDFTGTATTDGREHLAELWAERPVLQHLHDFARARSVAPAAVLGSAIARAVGMVAPGYVLPPLVGRVGTLNQYFALVGRSGMGKGSADGAAAEALELVVPGLEDATRPWADPISQGELYTCDVGSGEGLAAAFVVWKTSPKPARLHRVRSCATFSVPEVDHLAAVGARQGATLLPTLRKAWSGEALNPQYVDPTKRLRVDAHSYRCTLTAGVQPRRAGVLLDDADGGTPQRFVWLPTDDPGAPDGALDAPAPFSVLLPPPLPLGRRVELVVSEEIRHTIKSARQRQLRGESGEALDGHALYAREKLAAGLAVLDGHLLTDGVTDDDWRLAGLVMDASDAVREWVVGEQRQRASELNRARGRADAERAEVIEDSAVQRAARAVRTRLDKAPDAEWIAASKLRKALDSKHRVHFADAVTQLVAVGWLEVAEIEYRGQSGQHVRKRS